MPDFDVYVTGLPGGMKQPIRALFNEAKKYPDGEVRVHEIIRKIILPVALNPDTLTVTAPVQPPSIVVHRYLMATLKTIIPHLFEPADIEQMPPQEKRRLFGDKVFSQYVTDLEISFGPKMKADGGRRRRKTRKSSRRRRMTRRR
jgi:hypothetical protein